jgi:hypothetical protein
MNQIDAKQINLDDQGVYYAINKNTGGINNVFQLVYEDAQWYLYQLKNVDKNGSMGWVILAGDNDYALAYVPEDEVIRYFAKPEFLEPKGTWQILRNARFGFGKFIPESIEVGIRFGLIVFTEGGGLVPLLIEKAKDEALKSLATIK